MTNQAEGPGPKGEKGYVDPWGGPVEPPDEATEQSLKGEPALRTSTEAFELELAEQKQKSRFRTAMIWCVPIVALLWLALIAVATFTGRIKGLHIGIPLGLTGAGLLTLVGLQMAWANSQPSTPETHPGSIVLKSGMKLFVE